MKNKYKMHIYHLLVWVIFSLKNGLLPNCLQGGLVNMANPL